MNHLFVARHGEYSEENDVDQGLTSDGVEEIRRLAGKIKEIYAGPDVVIVSSPLPRAAQSADIIKTSLGLSGYETSDVLANNFPYLRKAEEKAIGSLVERNEQHTALILVGHRPTTSYIRTFAKERWGEQHYYHSPEKGEAVYLNCATKEVKLLEA